MPVTRIALDYKRCKVLYSATSNEETREALQHIHISPEYAEATNGHFAVRIPHDPPAEFDGSLTVHRDVLKQVKSKHALVIDTETREAWISEGNLPTFKESAVAILPQGTVSADVVFPKLDVVWPALNGDTRTLALSKSVLRQLAEVSKHAWGHGRVVLSIAEHGKDSNHVVTAVEFKTTDPTFKVSGLAMPLRLED